MSLISVKQEDMTPPNSGNPIKEEGNAEPGTDSGSNFGQSNNNGSGTPQGQQQQGQGQNANNSNSKQCNNAEVSPSSSLAKTIGLIISFSGSICSNKVKFLSFRQCWRTREQKLSYTDNFLL